MPDPATRRTMWFLSPMVVDEHGRRCAEILHEVDPGAPSQPKKQPKHPRTGIRPEPVLGGRGYSGSCIATEDANTDRLALVKVVGYDFTPLLADAKYVPIFDDDYALIDRRALGKTMGLERGYLDRTLSRINRSMPKVDTTIINTGTPKWRVLEIIAKEIQPRRPGGRLAA